MVVMCIIKKCAITLEVHLKAFLTYLLRVTSVFSPVWLQIRRFNFCHSETLNLQWVVIDAGNTIEQL